MNTTTNMASMMAVENEARSISTRITKGGRKLTYVLNVIQQPKQARACGQGAKCEKALPHYQSLTDTFSIH